MTVISQYGYSFWKFFDCWTFWIEDQLPFQFLFSKRQSKSHMNFDIVWPSRSESGFSTMSIIPSMLCLDMYPTSHTLEMVLCFLHPWIRCNLFSFFGLFSYKLILPLLCLLDLISLPFLFFYWCLHPDHRQWSPPLRPLYLALSDSLFHPNHSIIWFAFNGSAYQI